MQKLFGSKTIASGAKTYFGSYNVKRCESDRRHISTDNHFIFAV
jgi:hypothetical protein